MSLALNRDHRRPDKRAILLTLAMAPSSVRVMAAAAAATVNGIPMCGGGATAPPP